MASDTTQRAEKMLEYLRSEADDCGAMNNHDGYRMFTAAAALAEEALAVREWEATDRPAQDSDAPYLSQFPEWAAVEAARVKTDKALEAL